MEGDFTIPLLERSFEPYLIANNKTEKPVLHISLNPHSKDDVSDEIFSELARQLHVRNGLRKTALYRF